MSDVTWAEALISSVAIAFLFGGVAVVFIWIMKVAQAKVQADSSTEHTIMVRSLAEEATAAQRKTATELTEVRMAMVDIRDRLSAIERMMTEVG